MLSASVTVSESSGCDGGNAVQCEGHEHFDINIVDGLFAINVDDMFNKLFTDSPFYAEFARRRHTSGTMPKMRKNFAFRLNQTI